MSSDLQKTTALAVTKAIEAVREKQRASESVATAQKIGNLSLRYSIFSDVKANTIERKEGDWCDVVSLVMNPTEYASKEACPLLKLATFGNTKTPAGAFRHDDNMVEVFGIEGDYDAEQVSIEQAADMLTLHGIKAVLYTSASHGVVNPPKSHGGPRWRVLAPLFKGHPPADRTRFVAMLNTALGGILAGESDTLSQSFYFGKVRGVEYKAIEIEGDCIDTFAGRIAEAYPIRNKSGSKTTKAERLDRIKTSDPVFEHLQDLGMVERDMTNGKFSILCPFESQHSDFGQRAPGDGDTVYWLPHTGGFEHGAFCCTHDHCKEHTQEEFREAIGYQEDILSEFTDNGLPDVVLPPPSGSLDLDDLFNELALTKEDVAAMAEAEFLIDNLVVRGSLSVFVAPANGGKTTLFIHLCEELAARGMRILYVNADASPSDLKRHFAHSAQHGYTVLAPDAKIGKGPKDIIEKLQKLNNSATDMSNVVIILDTLKKFTAMINKSNLRAFLALMRGVSTKGATVIMLAHTNKYVGDDGKHVFEGTGDLRNDVDHLIYLEGGKDESKRRQEITTRPDKVRATFKPVSYWIDLDTRQVQRSDKVLPVVSDDERAIAELATKAILDGQTVQVAITKRIKDARPEIGDKRIRATLHKLSAGEGRLFNVCTGANNALVYSLNDEPAPPAGSFSDLSDIGNGVELV